MPVAGLGKVRADRVEVDGFAGPRLGGGDVARFDEGERVALEHGVADRDGERLHETRGLGGDDVLHLHRFHHQDRAAARDERSGGDVDGDDRPLHRRRQRHRAGGRLRRRGIVARRALAVIEDRERIRAVDRGAGAARSGRRRRVGVPPPGRRLGGLQQRLDVVVDEARVGAARDEVGVREHRLQEGDVGRRPVDAEFRQRPRRLRGEGGEIAPRGVHDHLGQERIEARVGAVAGVSAGVRAHARSGRAGRTP